MKKLKDVLITLKSVQFDGKDRQETELITEGNYKKTADGYVISYNESEATGFKGSKTTLTAQGDEQVTMQRNGTANTSLVIEKGKKHHCHYGTPFGEFMIGITAGNIKSSLDENGGDLYFKYVVDINSSFLSDHEIFISVK